MFQCDRYASSDPQKLLQIPGPTEVASKHLPAMILDDERRLSLVANQLYRPRSPSRIELVPQPICVLKARDAGGRGMVHCRG
jgi:hypothetical protein